MCTSAARRNGRSGRYCNPRGPFTPTLMRTTPSLPTEASYETAPSPSNGPFWDVYVKCEMQTAAWALGVLNRPLSDPIRDAARPTPPIGRAVGQPGATGSRVPVHSDLSKIALFTISANWLFVGFADLSIFPALRASDGAFSVHRTPTWTGLKSRLWRPLRDRGRRPASSVPSPSDPSFTVSSPGRPHDPSGSCPVWPPGSAKARGTATSDGTSQVPAIRAGCPAECRV